MKNNNGLDGAITGRAKGGKFAAGNPGGPGRPRRETERDYLRVTIDAVPLDLWKQIIESTVTAAGQGDRHAREFLANYLLGRAEGVASTPHDLAVEELAGSDPIERGAARKRESDMLANMLGNY